MGSPHVYWHLYPQDQIKPELRGGLICVLQVPWVAGTPVARDIVDPVGHDFPSHKAFRFPAPMRTDHHGILYLGVSKASVYSLMLTDPEMLPVDPTYAFYNRQVIASTRNFFLLDPNRGFKTMPQHMVQLL